MDARPSEFFEAKASAKVIASPVIPASEAGGFDPPPINRLHAETFTRSGSSRIVGGPVKRIFDVLVAGSALVALSPFLLGVWAAVRIDSPGPGLFRQRRSGFQGRPFYILKFRTMKTCETKTITQAKDGDSRTTPLGRTLRKLSIDELPQLINVLKGEMSLIGPRPHALAHDRQFMTMDRAYAGRFRARPGITGLAQVSGSRGRTETPEKIAERLQYDLEYVRTWSLRMDISIVIRTVLMLLKDRTAF